MNSLQGLNPPRLKVKMACSLEEAQCADTGFFTGHRDHEGLFQRASVFSRRYIRYMLAVKRRRGAYERSDSCDGLG